MRALIALGVFVAAALLDYATAKYNFAIREAEGHAAGLWSIAMCLLGATALLALVDVTPLMLAPECTGLYVGTRVAVWHKKRALASQICME